MANLASMQSLRLDWTANRPMSCVTTFLAWRCAGNAFTGKTPRTQGCLKLVHSVFLEIQALKISSPDRD